MTPKPIILDFGYTRLFKIIRDPWVPVETRGSPWVSAEAPGSRGPRKPMEAHLFVCLLIGCSVEGRGSRGPWTPVEAVVLGHSRVVDGCSSCPGLSPVDENHKK